MRQQIVSDYRSPGRRCKHICRFTVAVPISGAALNHLTVFTSALLLLVGCAAPTPPLPEAKVMSAPTGSARSNAPTLQPLTGSTIIGFNPSISGWQSLFDGRSLRGWAITDFAVCGVVRVEAGRIILDH